MHIYTILQVFFRGNTSFLRREYSTCTEGGETYSEEAKGLLLWAKGPGETSKWRDVDARS